MKPKKQQQKGAAAFNKREIQKEKTRAANPYWMWAGIVVITFVAFFPALNNDFTNWDDAGYVTENPLVKSLSFQNLKAIFSTYVMGNYHPLAILSLAVDYHFYQLSPQGYHVTSVLFHLVNVSLLFIFVNVLVRNVRVAAITALLFAIHPMHVESVAWVAERKDVGYVMFYFLTLILYLKYHEATGNKPIVYICMIISFLISILFKGQAVTLPVVMLLIDFFKGRKIMEGWKEKIPFFVLSILFGVIAIYAQKDFKSIHIEIHPFYERVLFSAYALISYLWKLLLPVNLSAFYPYPVKHDNFYPLLVYLSPAIVIGIIVLLYRSLKTSRDFIFGALFFFFNVILILQLLPVGNTVISERYSYLSYTGL
ncbi:MAG: hypothetical protein JJE25_06090, partial [Bacteroidia bacterium]|nr:hypothetical protein [Bacteroidia bacterium]